MKVRMEKGVRRGRPSRRVKGKHALRCWLDTVVDLVTEKKVERVKVKKVNMHTSEKLCQRQGLWRKS